MALSSLCPSFLSVFIRNLNYLRAKSMDSHLLVTPAIFKPGSTVLKAFGFPIEDFGNDGGRGCLIEALRHDGGRKTPDGRLYIFFPSLGGQGEGVFFAIL